MEYMTRSLPAVLGIESALSFLDSAYFDAHVKGTASLRCDNKSGE